MWRVEDDVTAAARCNLRYFPEFNTLQFAIKTGIKVLKTNLNVSDFILISHPSGIQHALYFNLHDGSNINYFIEINLEKHNHCAFSGKRLDSEKCPA